MPERAPRVTGGEAVRALQRGGWQKVRQSGSHLHLKHPNKPGLVTVPVHGREILHPKTLAAILVQAGLTMEEFRALL